MLLFSAWYLLINSAYNNADKGVDVYEKTPEELKRERDMKRYAMLICLQKQRRKRYLKSICLSLLIIIFVL